MPELPEVETTVRGLRPHLPGRRVVAARLRYRSLYRQGSLSVKWLVGRTIERVERVGKNVVLWFRPAGLMLVNLGMTGRLVASVDGDLPPGTSAKHLHCRMRLDGGLQLHYFDARRFGHFYIAEKCDFAKDLNIGPDPFLADAAYLKRALHGRTASIKALLLDQRILSGIGNIYADETLFFAGLDPRTRGGDATRKAARILQQARSVMRRAIEHGGSTLRDYRKQDGSPGEFQEYHAVYGRGGDECLHCGSEVKRIVLAGRGTHFCPACQT